MEFSNWWLTQLQKQTAIMEQAAVYTPEERTAHRNLVVEVQLKLHLEKRRVDGVPDADFKKIRHFIKNACQCRDYSPIHKRYKEALDLLNQALIERRQFTLEIPSVYRWNGEAFVSTCPEIADLDIKVDVAEKSVRYLKTLFMPHEPRWIPHRRWWAKGYLKSAKPSENFDDALDLLP